MNTENSKQRQKHFDRVTLNAQTLERIDSWIAQAESAKAGVQLSRKDLLNWLVLSLPEKLTVTQEKSLCEEFYSELRYIQFAAREIRAAKVRGEELTLKDIEARGALKSEPIRRKNKKDKPNESESQIEDIAVVPLSTQTETSQQS